MKGHLIKYWGARLFQYTLQTKITKIGLFPSRMKNALYEKYIDTVQHIQF